MRTKLLVSIVLILKQYSIALIPSQQTGANALSCGYMSVTYPIWRGLSTYHQQAMSTLLLNVATQSEVDPPACLLRGCTSTIKPVDH